MAPPNSSKEPRRSNRRSAHSSTSASKSSGSRSPDATSVPLPAKEPDNHSSARSAASSSSNSNSARPKRAKEEHDDSNSALVPGHRRTTSVTSVVAAIVTPAPKRTKRRGKDTAQQPENIVAPGLAGGADSDQVVPDEGQEEEEEDAGVTRCVCEGLVADDDGDAAEFMIQCEICKVWQHGPCMGFANEDEIPQGDYYCEQCRPDDHVELLKRLQKRQRQSSEKSLHASHLSRTSRSHSPTHFHKASKRRNTMNSRDAAYEQRIQELIDATATELTPAGDTMSRGKAASVAGTEEYAEEVVESGTGSRKKRKRVEEEVVATKRKRSASNASERLSTTFTTEKVVESSQSVQVDLSALLPPLPPPTGGKSRVRRGGGRKTVAADAGVGAEGEDSSAATRKHPNQYTYRGKSGTNPQPRRHPPSVAGQNQAPMSTHEHGTRRNVNNAANTGGTGSGTGTRGTHQAYYNNMQMPMFTSWHLPDYLAHLQTILPTEVPPPLQIRGATSFFREDVGAAIAPHTEAEGGDNVGMDSTSDFADAQNAAADRIAAAMAGATEALTERGVKVKWPAKRMSVADMNKRVRALVEWVGREQALALERERRKIALERDFLANQQATTATDLHRPNGLLTSEGDESILMTVDGAPLTESPAQEKTSIAAPSLTLGSKFGALEQPDGTASTNTSGLDTKTLDSPPLGGTMTPSRPSTTKIMEELMEELINFQERFGPGAKGQGREKTIRSAAMS